MEKNDKFWDWCQSMHALNIILWGTPSHLTETVLHNQLEASLDPSLCLYCVHEKLGKITVLKDWIAAVKEANKKLKDDRKHSCEIFWEKLHYMPLNVLLCLTTPVLVTRMPVLQLLEPLILSRQSAVLNLILRSESTSPCIMAASSADDLTRITVHTTACMASQIGSCIRKLLLLAMHVEMLPRRKKGLPPQRKGKLSQLSPSTTWPLVTMMIMILSPLWCSVPFLAMVPSQRAM